ncbi:hypothetical protein SAMN02745146_0072 [Hymenobacter daecheongensis DSM 21074]|uniref:Uncharacterized protein n=1 Tax=Hymenobacter daecheongensis DSM 21074 TaxID=1121955 RepID=A0A1M6LVK3_9BACT|nr:hypothetical protein [Hymenobacter daecheongensis]SHJ75247.1 hypothetical protein SAMN02745146_0072 [Hymenobacter daecheongensis DSM 21074]
MNTRLEIELLTLEVCERLHLTLAQVMEVQVDLASDYLKALCRGGWLAGPEEAQLLAMLPEFWAWWRQRWANRDRNMLAGLNPLAVLEWQQQGRPMQALYFELCRHLAYAGGAAYPNDVIMAAFEAEKRRQQLTFSTLKDLFN